MNTNTAILNQPQYDQERLQADFQYRYSLIDDFTAYMNTIENFNDRVLFFIKTSKAMGLRLYASNLGENYVPEYPCNYDGVRFVDQKGKPVEIKRWRLVYSTDEERAIFYKLLFLETRHEVFKKLGHFANESLEKRKERYYINSEKWLPSDYLEHIDNQIDEIWKSYEPDKKKRKGFNIPGLIRSELMEECGFDWLAVYRSRKLQQVIAFLWDMVGFRRFLDKQINNPTKGERKQDLPPQYAPPEVAYLYIPESIQTRVYKSLSLYVPEDQHAALELLLHNGKSESRIWVKKKARSIAYLFKEARDRSQGCIDDDDKAMANFISSYFDWSPKLKKPISYSTAYDIVRGAKPVDKKNQIVLRK